MHTHIYTLQVLWLGIKDHEKNFQYCNWRRPCYSNPPLKAVLTNVLPDNPLSQIHFVLSYEQHCMKDLRLSSGGKLYIDKEGSFKSVRSDELTSSQDSQHIRTHVVRIIKNICKLNTLTQHIQIAFHNESKKSISLLVLLCI